MESLRAELAEAKEEISKLSQDMHGQRRSVYRYNQLEELRNLQVRHSGLGFDRVPPGAGTLRLLHTEKKLLYCYY